MPWSLIQYRVNGRVIVTSPCGYSTNLTFLFRSESVWLYGSVGAPFLLFVLVGFTVKWNFVSEQHICVVSKRV